MAVKDSDMGEIIRLKYHLDEILRRKVPRTAEESAEIERLDRRLYDLGYNDDFLRPPAMRSRESARTPSRV